MESRESNPKRLGQLCLVVAVVINGVLLLVNLRQTGLEDQLSRKRSAEGYFILNQQTISGEDTKRELLHTSLNQLKMLRRLSKDRLSEIENQTLLSDERELEKQEDAALGKIVAVTYLQANDPPPGQQPDEMFSHKSVAELQDLLKKFEEQAFQYAKDLKDETVNLMGKIAFWKAWYSTGLVINMFVLVIGNIMLFASDAPRNSQTKRKS